MNLEPNKFNGEKQDKKIDQTKWDNMVEDLNNNYPDEERISAGTSEGFKRETNEYRELGDQYVKKLTKNAKEAIGVRDGQDLGELMQESDSWDRQIEQTAEDIGKFILAFEEATQQVAERQLRNLDIMAPEYGEETYRRNLEERKLSMEERKERLLNDKLKSMSLLPNPNMMPPEVVTLEALVYLAAGQDAPKTNPNGRNPEDLKNAAMARYINRVLSDEEAFRKLQNESVYRMIQQATEVWKANKDGTYEPADKSSDFRETRIYKDVDKILSGPETVKPFGE